MLAVAPNCITRSSLEEMLEALQRRDESESRTPPGVPPALPRRAVSRSRPPSAKRRLPIAGGNGERSEFCMKNGKMRGNGFRDEKDREMESGEWGYVAAADEKMIESAPNKIGFVKEFRLQGTPQAHKGLDDPQHHHKLNAAAVTFQSYVCGEIARKECNALLGMKKQDDLEKLATVQLQSVIRGWLARRHFSHLQKLIHPTHGKEGSRISISEVKNLNPDMLSLVVGELQKRVAMAEETLELKEKENASFREQLQQYESGLKQSEAKMKATDEMWQKQIASLQMDLAAAEKSVIAKSVVALPPASQDGGHLPHSCRKTNEGIKPGSNDVKEFSKRKVTFEDEKRAIVGGRLNLVNPIEKLQRLKRMIKAWMKENKVRLRNSKTKIHSIVIRGHGGERKARDHRSENRGHVLHETVSRVKIC